MLTSAGIGLHFEEALHRSVHRAVVVDSAWRALTGGVAAFAVAGVCAFVAVALGVERQATCAETREAAGFGRKAALSAMEHPDRQSRFLYRVQRDAADYKIVVVAKDGDFVGDTWERDATGRVRHLNDVCAP